MNRSRVAWLLSLPLSAAGMVLAHELAWELGSHEHEAEAAHGYLQYGAIFAALGAALVVVAATTQLVNGVTGAGVARAPSARTFAVVPVVGFMLQEHLEHIVAARELELTFFLSTPFLLGLALQLPFMVAAFVVARLILGLVARAVRALGTLDVLPGLTSLRVLVPLRTELPPQPAVAGCHTGRAPPRLP